MENKITHNGSRYTKTHIKNSNKDTIIISVWITSDLYGHNQLLIYNHSISVKKYKCRNEEFKYCSKTTLDDRYKDYITEQDLYTAYHNHWNKINPITLFSNGVINGEHTVKEDINILTPCKVPKQY